ncbi:VapC toxin family PIN domain ribonuclease [Microbacteriaceae bacterium VKM Ac-2854]|nr:VapC toxin family PIN domain ribonuclease [Microbacteriaceae bacterium VKM Ac-2854]
MSVDAFDPGPGPRRPRRPPIRYLVDNSAWARLPRSEAVNNAFRSIALTVSPSNILFSAPTSAEIGYSARDGREHSEMMRQLGAFGAADLAPTAHEVLGIQNALWNAGLVRAVGAMDVVIAAFAIANSATVLHYDSDFEHIRSVIPEFSHRWIVPRGSLA